MKIGVGAASGHLRGVVVSELLQRPHAYEAVAITRTPETVHLQRWKRNLRASVRPIRLKSATCASRSSGPTLSPLEGARVILLTASVGRQDRGCCRRKAIHSTDSRSLRFLPRE